MNRWTWHHNANLGQLQIIMQSANVLYKKVQNKHGKQLNFMYHEWLWQFGTDLF